MQYGPEPLRIDAEQNFQGTGPDAGMIAELAIDPRGTTDQVVYQSNNDGGIWKTTDGGATWTPLTDYMPSNSMGARHARAGNPSIVYAGTGNLFNNGYFNPPVSTARSTPARRGRTSPRPSSAPGGSTEWSLRPPTSCSSRRTTGSSSRSTAGRTSGPRRAHQRLAGQGRQHQRPPPRHHDGQHRVRGGERQRHLPVDRRWLDVGGANLFTATQRCAEPRTSTSSRSRSRPVPTTRPSTPASAAAPPARRLARSRTAATTTTSTSPPTAARTGPLRAPAPARPSWRRRLPVRLRPDDRRRPGRCEQGLHRLPAALLLERRRRGPVQRRQRQQDPLGRARDRVQSRDAPVARPETRVWVGNDGGSRAQ